MKKVMLRSSLLIAFCLIVMKVSAQTADSTVFTFDNFYDMLVNHHPVVKQAELISRMADRKVGEARGAFDPKVEVKWDQKDFKDTEYYDKFKAALKVPVWLPVDPEVGFERNEGQYLNPENYISESSDNKQLYGGVSVTLGRGLFIDERRAALRQAKIYQDMAVAEQTKLVNKLILEASADYWEWYAAYYNFLLATQAIDLANDIFERTTLAFEYGEAAAIDTVQALVLLQNRKIEFQQADLDRKNAALRLSIHLWDDNGAPLELEDSAYPQTITLSEVAEEELTRLLELASNNHPELVKLRAKNEMLLIDNQLARENLKPKLDVGYYLIDQPYNVEGESSDVDFDTNYKVGLNFSLPLFLRKERAKIAYSSLKIEDNQYALTFKEREIINDINYRYNALLNTIRQVEAHQQMVISYNTIVNAERLNMANGESDLFKLNSQLDKLLESRRKLIKLNATFKKDQAYLYWSAGLNVRD